MSEYETVQLLPGVSVKRKKREADKDHLIPHRKDGLVRLTAPVFDARDWLTHGFTTRLGGVSEGEIGSMNLSFTRGDREENVRENYRRLAEAVGFDPGRLVMTFQTHTANVRIVTAEDAGKGYDRERGYVDVDGLVTDVPGLTLACYGADCMTLLAADPVRRVVGCAHSGWRGTVADIAGNLVRTMAEHYGSDPGDILAAIGPSICGDCYEVGREVVDCFASAYPEDKHAGLFWKNDNGAYQLDLWQACRLNFERAGISGQHICVTDYCTRCNPQLFFSHRIQKGRQTNQAALIGII